MTNIAYTRKVGGRHNAYDLATDEPISGGQGWKSATRLWVWLQEHGHVVTRKSR